MAKEITIRELTENELIEWYYKSAETKKYVEFYVSELKKYQQPMLEINCGTGEILKSLVAEGIVCHGLDCAADQVKICGDELTRQNLESTLYSFDYNHFSLPNKYNTIFIPQSTLCMISDLDAVKQFLINIKAVLPHYIE